MRIVRVANGWKVLSPGLAGGVCLQVTAWQSGFRLAQICDALQCSERYFRRVFESDTGLSPKRWLKDERMLRARQLLEQGREPGDVAEMLGFARAATFRREFLATYGVMPGSWRERLRPRACQPSSGG